MPAEKVAIITGGASGIGLAVAASLSQQGWKVHVFDKQEVTDGRRHADVSFREVDVTSWAALSAAFDAVFRARGRLDFVFANAGVMEKPGFYARHDAASLPPPPPDETGLDVNLRGMARTAYLAQHYFRANPGGPSDCVVILTASVAGIYPQALTPLYAAGKAGVVNFVRSVAEPFYANDGIRTYAICPGSVRTPLLPQQAWDAYPAKYLTAMEKVTSTVDMLLQGGSMRDSAGKLVEGPSNTGLTVEIFVDDVYFREAPEPCNEGMKDVIEYMSTTMKTKQ
ncbi:hypothetical protein F4780DRAFT_608412 [Xylariomycetidae sp. FL0641]|nr:hypothetical protein F4780DRAFT_608412 [Xylariomycetidae sp. FL0641]